MLPALSDIAAMAVSGKGRLEFVKIPDEAVGTVIEGDASLTRDSISVKTE